MATLFTIDYEAGTAGSNVGSESGWTTNAPAGVYDAGAAEAGSLGIKITGQGVHRVGVSSISAFRVRWYNEVPVIAPGVSAVLAQARLSGTAKCGVRLESAGTYRLTNGASATGSSSASLVANTRDRLEWWVDGPNGTMGLDIFRGSNRNGTVPDEQLTGTYTNSAVDDIGVCFPVTVTSFVVLQDEIKTTDAPAVQIGGFGSSASPAAQAATGAGAALDAGTQVVVNAQAATGVGESLFDPGSTVGLDLIADNPVLGVGAALDAQTGLLVNSEVAAAAGTAGDITSASLQSVFPGAALAVGEAWDCDNVFLFVYPDVADGTGAAYDVAATVPPPVTAWTFTGPTRTVIERPFAEMGVAWGPRVERVVGLTVLRVGGVWRAAASTNAAEEAAADRLFYGGHIHIVDQVVHDELIAAGFGANLTPITG